MGASMNFAELLTALTDSLESSSSSLPEPAAIAPPPDGISLLDTKNELLLSYLQNLVFLIILKLRDFRDGKSNGDQEPSAERENVTKKLVELRVYLEKGIRPLEGKLQYQLDKLLHAANEADAAALNESTRQKKLHAKSNGTHTNGHHADSSPSDSDSVSHSSRSASPLPAPAGAISDLSHRPNLSAFSAQPTGTTKPTKSPRDRPSNTDNAPYRPPRINPTALPTTTSSTKNPDKATRARKSHMLDDFIREELTDAPLAQPSIGAGSRLRGREKADADERREYEESRLVRLPGNSAAAAAGADGRKKGKKRGGLEFGDDGRGDLEGGWGGVTGVDFRGAGAAKRRRTPGSGVGEGRGERKRVGEDWERRVKKGLKRKKGRRV